MAQKSAINAAMPSLVPPEVQALIGEPPLMRGEDLAAYNKLVDEFTKIVGPADVVEWFWIKDITDHTWEIRRLRRFKVLFVEVRREEVIQRLERAATVLVDEDAPYEPVPVPDSEMDSVELFITLVDQYKNVDKMIASAERRRDETLRQIERRRQHLARRLRKVSDEIIDDKPSELAQAA